YIAGRRGQKSTATVAAPASPLALLTAIPIGMERQAALIFMILFVGGMFGVLQETGALESGISRLVAASRGNVVAVVSVVMVLLAAGSSFLGLISGYLVLIPIAVLLAERLGFDALFGVAMVTIAAKIGYLTSVPIRWRLSWRSQSLAFRYSAALVSVRRRSRSFFQSESGFC